MELSPLPEQPLQVDFKTCDGMFVKQIFVHKANSIIPQHAHVLDHTTLLAKGSIVLRRPERQESEQLTAPQIIFIPAGEVHEFITLEDGVVLYCLHNLHHGDAPQILREHQLDIEEL